MTHEDAQVLPADEGRLEITNIPSATKGVRWAITKTTCRNIFLSDIEGGV